jgi:bacterioferritin-associated ferredoxin
MIICSCNVLSDHEVRNVVTAAWEQPLTADQVHGCLGCNVRCGRCARAIKRIMSEALAESTATPVHGVLVTRALCAGNDTDLSLSHRSKGEQLSKNAL